MEGQTRRLSYRRGPDKKDSDNNGCAIKIHDRSLTQRHALQLTEGMES